MPTKRDPLFAQLSLFDVQQIPPGVLPQERREALRTLLSELLHQVAAAEAGGAPQTRATAAQEQDDD
ncbi:MAG: hypothetical protein AADX96_03075 [Thiocapsa sp. C3-sup]|uniref:hypothetical protein n=1 Tax=unclassified Thiocapsa TaxID=2641286 RepID=UPI0035AFEFF4